MNIPITYTNNITDSVSVERGVSDKPKEVPEMADFYVLGDTTIKEMLRRKLDISARIATLKKYRETIPSEYNTFFTSAFLSKQQAIDALISMCQSQEIN